MSARAITISGERLDIPTGWPASLAGEDANVSSVGTSKLLDVLDRLGHVVEVVVGSVADVLALPVGKGIGHAVGNWLAVGRIWQRDGPVALTSRSPRR